jgi:hypothetical protein
MSTVVTVPVALVSRIRNGLYDVLGDVAEEISGLIGEPGREEHAEWYEAPRSHFDGACALLDTIGWDNRGLPAAVRIELRIHRWAVTEALRLALIVADAELEEADAVEVRAKHGEPAKPGAAAMGVLALRQFAASVNGLVNAIDIQNGESG